MNRATFLKIACLLFVFCAATAIASPAQVLTTLYSFQGPLGDGANPAAGLVHASDGNFYGTTFGGGANRNSSLCLSTNGCGAVFKMTPSGTVTLLYSFCSQSHCSDGANPKAGLVQSGDGNLYGTTFNGGISCSPVGCGTVFKITPSGTLTTMHRFNANDGYWPYAGLVQASDGNFYGTTNLGGINGLNGQGTVFKITPSGAVTTLYNFCSQSNCSDGAEPYGALVQASDGNFYGTVTGGGANGDGTVFKITPTGAFTTLHSFVGASEGAYPYDALLQASDGNFYGTTFEGGTHSAGTVFKITPSGVLITLHNFAGLPSDGALSTSALVQAGAENLYGTAGVGGAGNYGTLFRLTLPRACRVCPNLE